MAWFQRGTSLSKRHKIIDFVQNVENVTIGWAFIRGFATALTRVLSRSWYNLYPRHIVHSSFIGAFRVYAFYYVWNRIYAVQQKKSANRQKNAYGCLTGRYSRISFSTVFRLLSIRSVSPSGNGQRVKVSGILVYVSAWMRQIYTHGYIKITLSLFRNEK